MQFEKEYEKILFYDFLDDDKKKHVYLEDGDKHICRFCGKSEDNITFDKSAHAISEMIGNRWLFSYRECKECNTAFGNTCEDSFGKYLLPLKIVSQVYGKKKSIGYSNGHALIKINKEDAVLEKFSKDIKAMIQSDKDNSVLFIEEGGFTLKLERKKYIPQLVYYSMLKMALTILPFEEYSKYVYCYTTLFLLSRKKINYDKINVCGFAEFIPGPEKFENVNAELYRLKNKDSNKPYMFFCLNFGNYSLQIPLPTDQQQMGGELSVISCIHFDKSEIKELRFDQFEEIYECHFSATIKEITGSEKEKLANCINCKS